MDKSNQFFAVLLFCAIGLMVGCGADNSTKVLAPLPADVPSSDPGLDAPVNPSASEFGS